jgi:DNA-binding response OmpR family regulator
MKILVIDDDHEQNLLTSTVLRGAGYEALEAHTGSEGIEKVHAHRPDMVLLNVVLPDISGIEACRQIKKNQVLKDISVILTSDEQTSSEYREKGLNMEADGFIVKPISNGDFLHGSNQWCGSRRQRKRLKPPRLVTVGFLKQPRMES